MRVESQRAVQRYGEELQRLVDTCTTEMQEVKRAFNKGALGSGEEAVEFSSTMQAEVQQVQCKVPPLVSLSNDVPRANDLLGAAFAQLKAITDVFDRFEERLESVYGISPVVVQVRGGGKEEAKEQRMEELVGGLKNGGAGAVGAVGAVSPGKYSSVRRLQRTPTRRTGQSVRREVDEVAMLATPKMEDFGLCYDDLKDLGMSESGGKGSYAGYGGMSGRGEMDKMRGRKSGVSMEGISVDFGQGDIYENVQKSMTALGIETPVQVADRFESRRHDALTKVMVTTTPRLKAGGIEQTRDYTGLAGGYFASAQREEEQEEDLTFTHRQLNFDETPQVERKGAGMSLDEVYRVIEEKFDVCGIWKSRVSIEDLQEAVVLLMRERRKVFQKPKLNDILTDGMEGCSSYAIIACLAKMQVLKVEATGSGQAVYRLVCV